MNQKYNAIVKNTEILEKNDPSIFKNRSNFSVRSNSPVKSKIIKSAKKDINQINTVQNTQTFEENYQEFLAETTEIQSPLLSRRFSSAGKGRISSLLKNNDINKIKKSPVLNKQELKINRYFKRVPTPLDLTQKVELTELYSTVTSIKKQQLNLPNSITAASYLIMNKKTGNIILGNKIQSKRQIASITKLMTALTVINICKLYEIQLNNTIVSIQQQAAQMQGTSANLKYGDQLSITDLLYAMLLPSGNDAAYALAQHFSKFLATVRQNQQLISDELKIRAKKSSLNFDDNRKKKDQIKYFIQKMNSLAKHLGLLNTRFENPTGLQGNSSFSTAYDVGILSSHCIDNNTLRSITQKKTYHCSVYNFKMCTYKIYYWKNTNKLLWRRRECIGLKTGHTPWAGPCLTAAFNIKNSEIIIVILKGLNTDERFNDVDKLYTWYKQKYLS